MPFVLTPVSTTVSEGVGTITFTITRSPTTGAETVFFSTVQNQGFTNSGDYTGRNTVAVNFAAGVATQTITVSVTNDTTPEGTETFGAIIENAAGTVLDSSTFTITDNDAAASTFTLTPVSTTVSEGVGTVTFTITRSSGVGSESVFFSTVQNQGFTNSGDYTGRNTVAVNFSAGVTSQTITVSITNDTTPEGTETFGAIIENAGGTVLDSSTFTITDNDAAASTFTLTPVSTTVSEGVGTVTFTVTRSSSAGSETVFFSTIQNQGFTNSGDYTGRDTVAINFAAGVTSQTITVSITNDTTSEGTETFGAIIENAAGSVLDSSTFTITDNDAAASTFTLTPVSTTVGEGDGAITFTITRSSSVGSETVFFSTVQDQGSTNSGDYTGLNTVAVNFAAGVTTQTISVNISNDTTSEGTETFGAIIENASGTVLDSSTFTITDNDGAATIYSLTPGSTSVSEGVGTVTFTVTRSGSLPAETIFASTTTNQGSANGGDYTGLLNQAISFSSGQTTRTFTVSITNDGTVESNETFGAIIQRNSDDPLTTFLDASTFTIQDNDNISLTSYSLTPAATAVNEGSGAITFTITRSGSLPAETIFASTTTNQGSSNGGDYAGLLNQAISFASGQTSATITVNISNDAAAETNETFGLIVQRNSSDPIGTSLASTTFTIQDNDGGATYAITPASVSINEADGSISFSVSRTGPLSAGTVYISTVQNQGSLNNGDYVGIVNQAVTFASGQSVSSTPITISIVNDGAAESNETFALIVQQNATDAVTNFLASSSFTIVDNDAGVSPISISIGADVQVTEGQTVVLTVSLAAPATQTVTVDFATYFGTASAAGGDYGAVLSQTVVFDPGEQQQTIQVATRDDSIQEATETFDIRLSNPQGVAIADATATITILDNDGAQPTVTANTSLEFMVLLSAAAYQATPASLIPQIGFRVLGDADLPTIANFVSPDGLFENANAQAFAGVMGDTLYVAFRGTDEDADRIPHWVDKSAHYQLFSQFVEALRQYALTHPEIRHVQVTGHSLGAAMAQNFVTANSWLPDPHAITFANPGFGVPLPAHVNDPRIVNIFVEGDIIRQAAYVGQVIGQDVVVHDVAFGLDADSIDLHELSLYSAVVQAIGANGIAGSLSQITNGRDVHIYLDISRNLTTGAWTVIQPSSASIVLAQAMDQIFTASNLDEIVDLTWALSNGAGRGIYNLAPSQIDWLVDLIGGVLPGGLDIDPTARVTPGLLSLEIPGTGGYAVGFGVDRLVGVNSVIGGGGNDQIFGDDLANLLIGNAGTDTLSGRGGDDLLVGGLGGDALIGGGGVDVSSYLISSTEATWVRNPNGSWTVTSAADGVDTLTSVEFLDFTDRDVFLDRAGRSFSGNGTSDVLFRRNDGIMASWEVTGTTINSASFLPTAGAEWTPRGTGDISGDGRDDVIWQRNDGLVYAWLMNGGAVSSAVALTGIGAEWTFLGMGDFNGDLTDDFVWQRNDGLVYTWTMNNAAIAGANAITGLGSVWGLEGIGDFNSDGRDDFLWRRSDTGQTVIWQMNGSSIAASGATSAQVGLDWNVVGVGDTNGDGRDDIVLQRASDGMIAVWAMDGLAVMSSTNIAAANPSEWTVRGIGDYNGDGRDDILWHNSNGLVYTWLLNGSTIVGAGGLSGVGSEWTIVGGG